MASALLGGWKRWGSSGGEGRSIMVRLSHKTSTIKAVNVMLEFPEAQQVSQHILIL